MAVGTLTSTVQVSLTLGSTEYNLSSAASVVDVSAAVNQVVSVPFATEIEIFKVGATPGPGQLTNIDYIAIMNRNATNSCRIRIAKSGAETVDFKILPGDTKLLYTKDISVSETGVAFAAYVDIDTISARFDIADGELEYIAGQI